MKESSNLQSPTTWIRIRLFVNLWAETSNTEKVKIKQGSSDNSRYYTENMETKILKQKLPLFTKQLWQKDGFIDKKWVLLNDRHFDSGSETAEATPHPR